MKNRTKLFGIIALVAVIGFSFIACGGDDDGDGNGNGGGSGGSFTLTDIPSEYNGKYAFVSFQTGSGASVYGAQSYNTSTQVFTLSQISNESVSIPLWVGQNRYSGNDAVNHCDVSILNSAQISVGDTAIIRRVFWDNGNDLFSFSNGSTTQSWNDSKPY